MNILVTGGLGFIGANFIRYHLAHYCSDQVINLDALTYAANTDNLNGTNQSHYRFYSGNINNRNLVANIVAGNHVDLILNFAAESHVDRSISDPDIFVETNVLGVQTLLEVAKEHQVRLIQISTDEVYGSLPSGVWAQKTTPINPSSPYAASKASADLLVNSYQKTYGVQANIVRSTNNYGPYQNLEKLIPKAITHALRDATIELYGDGTNLRSWLYVEDNVRAIELVIEKGVPGEIYQVGSFEEFSNLAVTQMVATELGKSPDFIQFGSDRPGHDWRYGLDFARITSLGWKPEVDFASGLRRTIDWYQTNRAWWEVDV
ncbi:dTDP-glucose 4,6-dehydratase [Xylocopilactobacillus apicola]|uniref:dTDP-glucose 4,6-dehydratase n=1 Tax=Xylocopilactobacillus apicola TaxID=2932184 RepID=A0AAU9DAJ5_9LACO|nr:dTDP-glucose 4,6-dehydratase [Xylocopilactobacillus apicola]BDR59471.1 dTDP-glucose 4,6-dehydratase [Xylocopilactobacillus apicola]